MKLIFLSTLLLAELLTVTAYPSAVRSNNHALALRVRSNASLQARGVQQRGQGRGQQRGRLGQARRGGARAGTPANACIIASSSTTATTAAATATAPAAGGDEEAAENEVLLNAQFGDVTALDQLNIKTDILFPPSTSGNFELEFQDGTANNVTVTENKNPGNPPAGFVFFEPTSYIVKLGAAAPGATLQKIDYFFDPAALAATTFDLTKVKIGKLDAATNTFVVDNVGELEFEAEENEFTLTVDDLNGEWAILASAAAADIVNGLIEKEGEVELNLGSTFGAKTVYPGGDLKADFLYPGNAAGEFEIELKGISATTAVVEENTRLRNPPAGFLYVEPRTYVVSTDLKADSQVSLQKIDFFFSQAVRDSVDVTQLTVGKLQGEQFVVENIGEFELEDEENEITLTVEDLNGEWAILVPEAALL